MPGLGEAQSREALRGGKSPYRQVKEEGRMSTKRQRGEGGDHGNFRYFRIWPEDIPAGNICHLQKSFAKHCFSTVLCLMLYNIH